jgi:hypothetical protein
MITMPSLKDEARRTVERLVRRSSQREGGSDTHQLHLMEMNAFCRLTPSCVLRHLALSVLAAMKSISADCKCRSIADGAGPLRGNSPSGKSVSSPSRKNIPLNPTGKSLI